MTTKTWLETQFLDPSEIAELPPGLAKGDLLYIDAAGNLARLPFPASPAGQALIADAATGLPVWAIPPPVIFDPGTLSLTAWLKAYAGHCSGVTPWAGAASAGSSGSNTMSGSFPSDPALVSGGADYDGTKYTTYSGTNDTYFAAAAGSMGVLFFADTAAAPGAHSYNDACFVMDHSGNANVSMSFSTSGIRAQLNTGVNETGFVACSTGAWHFAQSRWDATNIEVRVDNGSWTSASSGGGIATALTGVLYAGVDFSLTTKFIDGRMKEILLSDTKLSDTNFNNIRSYINATYGLSI